MYYPSSAAHADAVREANEFLHSRTPQQARGFYFTAQEVTDSRLERWLQDELTLEQLTEQAAAAGTAQPGQQLVRPLPPVTTVLAPSRGLSFHLIPAAGSDSASPSGPQQQQQQQPPPSTSSSPRARPDAGQQQSPAPKQAAGEDGAVPKPPFLQQQSSMGEVDLSRIEDEQVRAAFDPKSDITLTTLAGWSDEQLDSVVEAFSPEFIPGLIRKSVRTEGGHTAQSLSWDRLSYVNKQGDALLKLVSGFLHPGQMTGILAGPDGGATPLLNVLAGREKASAWTGSVLYNGRPPAEDFNRWTGYVDKDDVHIALLTVFETLYFSARLRLPEALPDKIVRFRVKIVMKLLGLSHVADSIVGNAAVRGISGGEKRRVSFGVEMVAGRECLLADLPTNGLDSATAYALMRTMRFNCKGGMSMMASVVQPSPELFRLFHQIIVLSKGAVLYFGPPSHVEKFIAGSGFMRPASKSLPQFLEELSAAPERFYVHRFNRELKAAGQGDSDAVKQGQIKGEKHVGVGPDKNEPGDDKPAGGDEKNWQEQQQQQQRPEAAAGASGGEVELQSRSSGEGKRDGKRESWDESSEIPRPSVDNQRVQCWNLLVDRYESSPFKQHCKQEIEKDSQGDRDWTSDSQRQIQQQQGDKQQPSGRGQGSGQRGQPPQTDELLAPRPHPICGFWYRRYNSGILLQFKENFKRMSLIFLRNVGLWRNTWLRALFIAFILGSLFYKLQATQQDIRNRIGLIFFISLYLGFGGIQLFPILSAQRPVYYAQLGAGYYQGFTYYVALQLVQLPILIIETTLLLVPIWGLSNLSGSDFASNEFWFAWIVLVMTSLISRAWVMVLLSVSPIEAMANVLLVMTNILFVTLCGFLIPADEIEQGWHWSAPLSCTRCPPACLLSVQPAHASLSSASAWLLLCVRFHVISYISYTFRALVINDIAPLFNPCSPVGGVNCPYQSGADALEQLYGIDASYNKWKDFGRLCGIFIAFSFGAALMYVTLNWSSPDTPESPEWGEDEGELKQRLGQDAGGDSSGDGQQQRIQQQRQPGKLSKMKSKVVRSVGAFDNSRPAAQEAAAEPGDAPAATSQGQTTARDGGQGDSAEKMLAVEPMRSRDDSIPMPIPPAALRVAKAHKSNSSPALLQKEELNAQRQQKLEDERKAGDGGQSQPQQGQGKQKGKQQPQSQQGAGADGQPPPLQRAASHDFGFDIEHKRTEALVSGSRGFIQWKDLSYTVTLDSGKERQLLKKCFGYVRPGVMCALMGASGAGKSTLLDVLAGKKTSGRTEGEILVNGRPKDAAFTRIAGYVEQNDAHNPSSTVREAIAFSGRMRLPQSVSNKELELKVKNVLEVLGLAHLADMKIGSPGMGGVSPEVRKKVTIGVELVAEPAVLFLDEPSAVTSA